VLLKIDTVAPDQITVFGIETGKAQSVTQASCLRSSCLICWHFLPQGLSPTTCRAQARH